MKIISNAARRVGARNSQRHGHSADVPLIMLHERIQVRHRVATVDGVTRHAPMRRHALADVEVVVAPLEADRQHVVPLACEKKLEKFYVSINID